MDQNPGVSCTPDAADVEPSPVGRHRVLVATSTPCDGSVGASQRSLPGLWRRGVLLCERVRQSGVLRRDGPTVAEAPVHGRGLTHKPQYRPATGGTGAAHLGRGFCLPGCAALAPGLRPEREFREFYGVLAPTPWVVVGGLVGGEASAVHLQRAFLPGSLLTLWGWGSWFLPVGWTVFYDGATLNWFDLATLAAHERPVRQVLDNAQPCASG